MAGRNWMLRRMVIDAIRNDPEWRNGEYEKQPPSLHTAQVYFAIAMAGGALALHRTLPTRWETDAELNRRLEVPTENDANDVLFQTDAARDYNPWPRLEVITVPLIAVNSADDERNPPELGVLEQAMTRVKNGRYVLLPVTTASRGHGTTMQARLWKDHLAALLRPVPQAAQ
jgi:homoserine O-acetyltransferase